MSNASSVRSATWALLLVQLVLSCVAIVASVGIVCAHSQSKGISGAPLNPSPSLLFVCGLSFATLFSVILAMFGLSWLRPLFLLPIICASGVVCVFHTLSVANWLSDWWISADQSLDLDWLIIFTSAITFQAISMLAFYLQIRCYRLF
ncbi:hypothetical protein niasHT_003845 [Heterodera trifolii]|uniref:Uncharacterized protein n=1 Tax=Heterodera trifolii TaxID=157864 RepID=A0ABD2LUY3_9BILA